MIKNIKKIKDKRASILFLSVWVLSFLSLLAFYSGAYVKQQILAIKKIELRKKAYNLAKSAAFFAIEQFNSNQNFDLTKNTDSLRDHWADYPALFKDIKFSGGSASIQYRNFSGRFKKSFLKYGLIDEERKINLNYASCGVITNLIIEVGKVEMNKAFILANRIIDWRDSDDLKNIGEEDLSESIDYLKKGYNYTPKNSFFTSNEELILVDGVDFELFSKLENYITVFTRGKVNINTAGKEVLISLGLSDELVKKILFYRSGSNAIVGDSDDKIFRSVETLINDLKKYVDLSETEKLELNNLVSKELLVCSSDFFSGESVSQIDNASIYGKIKFVFNREGHIFYWISNL